MSLRFTPELVRNTGSIEKILVEFVEDRVKVLQGQLEEKFGEEIPEEAVKNLLTHFATDTGTKQPLHHDYIPKGGLTDESMEWCLEQLELARVLRKIDNTYELTHDALAKHLNDDRDFTERELLYAERLIRDRHESYDRTKTLLSEQELAYLVKLEKELKSRDVLEEDLWSFIGKSREEVRRQKRIELEKLEKEKRLQKRVIITFIAMAPFIIGFAVTSWWFRSEAQGEARKAESERKQAQAYALTGKALKLYQLKGEQYAKPEKALRILQLAATAANESDSLRWPNLLKEALLSSYREFNKQAFFFKQQVQKHGRMLEYSSFFPDGKRVLLQIDGHKLGIWDIPANTLDTIAVTDSIKSAVVTPDPRGRLLVQVYGGKDSFHLRQIDLEGKVTARLDRRGRLSFFTFLGSADTLVTGDYDGTVTITTMAGKELYRVRHKGRIFTAIPYPHKRMLITASADSTAVVSYLDTGRKDTLKHHHPVRFAGLDPWQQKYILTRPEGDTSLLWRLNNLSNPQAFFYHNDRVWWVDFSPKDDHLVTASRDGTARLWNFNGRLLDTLQHDDEVWTATFSGSGDSILTASSDGTARLWDARNATAVVEHSRLNHDNELLSAFFMDNGRKIITSTLDGVARVWAPKPDLLKPIDRDLRVVDGAIYPAGEYGDLLVSQEGRLHKVVANGVDLLETGQVDMAIEQVQYTADGKHFMTVADSGRLLLVRRPSGQVTLEVKEDSGISVWGASPKGDVVYYGLGRRLWIARTNGADTDSLDFPAPLASVAMHPDHEGVAVATEHKLYLYKGSGLNLDKDPKEIPVAAENDQLGQLQYAPDGETLLGILGNKVLVWGDDLEELAELTLNGPVYSASFSPDSKQILTASEDRRALIWTIEGEEVTRMKHQGAVRYAGFSPEGTEVLTLHESLEGQVRVNLWSKDGERIDLGFREFLSARKELDADACWARFSSRAHYILIGLTNGTVWAWRTPAGVVDWLRHSTNVADFATPADLGIQELLDQEEYDELRGMEKEGPKTSHLQ